MFPEGYDVKAHYNAVRNFAVQKHTMVAFDNVIRFLISPVNLPHLEAIANHASYCICTDAYPSYKGGLSARRFKCAQTP